MKNKYIYYAVLQEFNEYNGQWDDSVFYDTSNKEQLKDLREDKKAYRSEGVRVRVIHRRELNEQ